MTPFFSLIVLEIQGRLIYLSPSVARSKGPRPIPPPSPSLHRGREGEDFSRVSIHRIFDPFLFY